MKLMAKYLLMLFFLYSPGIMIAQDELPEPQLNSSPGGPPPPGLVLPIDKGIIGLLFAGLLLGGYTVSRLSRKDI